MLALVYMRLFLKDIRLSDHHGDSTMRQPILKESEPVVQGNITDDDITPKTKIEFKKMPSPGDLLRLLRSR